MKRISIKVTVIFVGIIFSNLSFAQNMDKLKEEKQLPNVEEVFNKRDKDKDGKLTKNELIGFVGNDFEKLDVDKDGFLSIQELAKSSKFQKRKRPNNSNRKRPNVNELFEQMDANKDEKLSKDEVKGPLAQDFSKIDSNGDGFLTKKEIEKAPKPKMGRRPNQSKQRF